MAVGPCRVWLRPAAFGKTAIVVCSLLLLVVACSGNPPTTGNVMVWYLSDIQSGDFSSAHGRLCPRLQERYSVEELSAASDGSNDLTRVGLLQQPIGRGGEHLELESLDDSVHRSWVEWTGHVGDVQELWRFDLERVDGDWKVCGAQLVDSYPCPLDNTASSCEDHDG